MSVPHSLPCYHPIHCNHGGLERFWKRLQRRRERGRESGRKGRTALNLICATDRPTVDTEKEPAERERGGREGALYIRHSLDSDSWQSSERERAARARACSESPLERKVRSFVPTLGKEEGHATARNFGDTPFLGDKPNLCQSRVCRPLSFCPQKEERG